jgi:hypothetical protein
MLKGKSKAILIGDTAPPLLQSTGTSRTAMF